MRSLLLDLYEKEGYKVLSERLGIKNPMAIPRLEKVVVSMGLKNAVTNSKVIDEALSDLYLITGQKPIVCKAKRSLAGFKLRQGMPIGCKVTLRGNRMYHFLFRLVNIALPRVKDFRGLSSKCFDGNGNFAMGINEQIVFPEIDYDKISEVRGMNFVFVTNTSNCEHAKALLEFFNFPFRR